MQNLPNDIIRIIFAFDGRWRSENGNWISIFHEDDQRYRKLHYMFRLRKYNQYICEGYNPQKHSFYYSMSHIFPIINHYEFRRELRFLHIKKIIIYDNDLFGETTSKCNIHRVFSTRIGCDIDMTDHYPTDEYFDHCDIRKDFYFGEYIE